MAHTLGKRTCIPLFNKIFNMKCQGLDKIPKNRTFILASNHASALDVFLIISSIGKHTNRKTSLLIVNNAYDFLPIKLLMKKWQAVRVDREDPNKRWVVKKAIRKLKKGNNILIFPEGTVHGGKVGHLVKAKTGVIRIGILSKTPIIPIGIKGSYQTWKFPETKPTFKNFISFHPFSRNIWIKKLI